MRILNIIHPIFCYLLPKTILDNNIKHFMSNQKGILAMDESINTIAKRFESISIENNISNRQNYRELLLSTPNIDDYISGVILSEETFLDHYKNPIQNIAFGVKVDCGLIPFQNSYIEKISTGLDTLSQKCIDYKQKGATFVKWRCVYSAKDNYPTQSLIAMNSKILAQYARISQENGLVPIIEPEILMDGNHSISKSSIVQKKILESLYEELDKKNIYLEGTILKTSITVPGNKYKRAISADKIAEITIQTLKTAVPYNVPIIMFLSGGLSETKSTEYLKEICKYETPWKISFSFGRALQNSCLKTWNGQEENKKDAQNILLQKIIQNTNVLNCHNYYKN